MKPRPAIALLLFLTLLTAAAQPIRPPARTGIISRTGQFIVFRAEADPSQTNRPGPACVRLEPELLTVSCERIKQGLLTTMGISDQWHGKIRISLYPFADAEEDIVVTSERFADGWHYRMELPDAIEPPRFVRALTQVLLLEMANRNAADRSAQLPAWLAEGLPALILADSDVDLVLAAPVTTTNNPFPSHAVTRDSRPADPLKRARECLGGNRPLSLAQLSQPPADGELEAYRCSAAIFIHQLLQLKNGGASLAAMLPELPWDPDWRAAFLKTFRPQFRREVDLAKWWALESVFIGARTPAKTWPRAESLRKLDEILRCPLRVQLATNDEPFLTDAPLQTVLQGWEFSRQTGLLQEKLAQLSALQIRTATDLASLIEQYRSVLKTYLLSAKAGVESGRTLWLQSGRHPTDAAMKPAKNPAASSPILKETLLQLDVLDQRREAWKALLQQAPEAAPPPPAEP